MRARGLVTGAATLAVLLWLPVASLAAEVNDSFRWERLGDLPPGAGAGGAFFGVHNGVLILAGGAVPGVPVEEQPFLTEVIWTARILSDSDTTLVWRPVGTLPRQIACGASVLTPYGVVCIGGENFRKCFAEVFLLTCDAQGDRVVVKPLPSLPEPRAMAGTAYLGDMLYVACGLARPDSRSAANTFWRLDLSRAMGSPEEQGAWELLAPLPAAPRSGCALAVQHNGQADCVYLFGGTMSGDAGPAPLQEAWRFDPAAQAWTRVSDPTQGIVTGGAVPAGQSHILALKPPMLYHTITDSWVSLAAPPVVAVAAVAPQADGAVYMIDHGRADTVRAALWRVAPAQTTRSLGATAAGAAVNYAAIAAYLLIIVLIGVSFSRRNKNTDDYFRGGRRVPWWVAGLSIFATMLSSITYVAIPAKAYATDWVYLVGHLMILAVTPFIVLLIMPFFRQIDATSAYEYLEKRFSLFLRLFGAASFVLFQIGRMAIVMFIPALALAAITPLHVTHCILAMGVLSILYCTLGGFEAVVWTDAIQTVVLLAAAFLSLGMIVSGLEGGAAELISTAAAAGKFHLVDLDFGPGSFATTALWVVVLGTVGQNLVTYTSDQAVIQRYVATSDRRKAAKAIWLNGILSVPAGILFFLLGTALFVFYKAHPQRLDPTLQTDAIFPLFIARELPAGLAGIVIAGILAAAQSTISTGMNSTATVLVTDFARRFNALGSERAYLNLARFLTVIIGCAATALALLFASGDVRSLWDQFLTVLGLFGGSMAGVFLLGIFTTRTSAAGAAFGAVAGAAALFAVKTYTDVHLLLYAAVGVAVCMVCGRAVSVFLPGRPAALDGLTIYTLDKNRRRE